VVIPTPGAWTEYFRGNNPEGKSLRELAQPIRCPEEFRRPDLRLRLMDEQGVDGCVLFPTTAGLLEEHMKADVELTHAVVHAYNEWLLEDWTFDYEGRIIPTPVVTLPHVDQAVAELEWCLDRGAKTVLIRPAPVPRPDGSSLSPALAEFDPFWRLCEDAGIPVMMHNADSGYDRYATDWEPGRDEFQGFDQTLFRAFLYEESRHIFDTLAAFVAHGLFQRFPRLRVGVVENGGAWVPRLLDCFDRVHKKMPGRFDEHPSDTLRRHVWINPFHEDDMRYLVDALGADRVLFGSDFPHPEGLGDPLEFVGELTDLPRPVVEQVMGGNLKELLALDPAGR
jgi:predicted TIM-barrel fold metal-dependent hydrolase